MDELNFISLKFILLPLKSLYDYVNHYNTLKEITELHSMFVKDPRNMMDHNYRLRVLEVGEKMKEPSFKEYFMNDSNKFISQLIPSFQMNVVKYAETFTISSKEEPILIVFQGLAGCGKSSLMNGVVSYLSSKYCNKSVYVHTVPSAESSKDFYDDYMNQETFVMDDVGQQGNSQWRQMINFVSPVKYPLDCAAAEKKNTKFFNSKIILCTTNQIKDLRFTTTDGIACPEALYRRVHLIRLSREGEGYHHQVIEYEKYDFMNTHTWVQDFIAPYEGCKQVIPSKFTATTLKDGVAWVVKLITKLQSLQRGIAEDVTLNDDIMKEIHDQVRDEENRDVFEDAQENVAEAIDSESFNAFNSELPYWRSFKVEGVEILKEYVSGFVKCCMNMINGDGILSTLSNIFTTIQENPKTAILTGLITTAFASLGYYFLKCIFTEGEDQSSVETAIDDWKKITEKRGKPAFWMSESGDDTLFLSTLQSFFKFVEVRSTMNGKEVIEMCQAIVSGDRIILPDHVVGLNPVVSVYKNWDARLSNSMELEQVRLKVLRVFNELDICVCKFEKLAMPLYKKAKAVFNYTAVASGHSMRFMNCYHNISLDTIGNYRANAEEMRVRSLKGMKIFDANSGIEYGISYNGLCGSALISESQGVMGFHVAGNGKDGFAVMMSMAQRNELRALMLDGNESKFTLHEHTYPDFSGARMHYEDGQVKTNKVMPETKLSPTQLNFRINGDVGELMKVHQVEPKFPPNYNKYGNTRQTMVEISRKAFEPMGRINEDELNYAKEVLHSFIEPFGDITLEEAVFGNEDLNSIKMDTANGYGWKLPKTELFDKDEKTISATFMHVYREFNKQCLSGDVDFKHYIAKDTFKDELRPEGKDPRVFRILPVQHMLCMKECLGNLMVHIKKNVDKNGIAIGLNPYLDWDDLYKKLKSMEICSDIDFEKWDKKLHALVQEAVNDVVMEKYVGVKKPMLDFLLKSVVRGLVLVGDEVLSTTHSMPSGSWVTTLFNSFVNKMISAMAFYRAYLKKYKKPPTVQEFHELLDYVMGDDKLMGAPAKFADVFNALTVQEIAKDLGMTCTDGLKRKITRPNTPLSEITFLKRNFVFHPVLGKYVGPLALATLINTIQWYDSSKDYDVVMNGKLTAVQIEAFLHSPKLRDTFYSIGVSALPGTMRISDNDIIRIMTTDEGYAVVQRMLGKDFLN
nr:MAG: RNA-dependent RNA polymerase [Chemarfal virus 134]